MQTAVELIATIHPAGGGDVALAARANRNGRVAAHPNGVDSASQSSTHAAHG